MYTAVVDAPNGRVTLGANMANGIEQKGIDSLQQCIKKCAAAGLGIPATVSKPTHWVKHYFYVQPYNQSVAFCSSAGREGVVRNIILLL